MNNIYELDLGDNLINSENYNDEILDYLLSEAKLITYLINTHDIIVEVGCMHGRLLKDVIEKSKKYIGIDNSKAYIKKGRLQFFNHLNDNVQLIHANCEKLHILKEVKSLKPSTKAVLIFPFNSFGNVQNIKKAINSISKFKFHFYIFTYQCNRYTTNARLNYYVKSGFKNPVIFESRKSIQIKDELGLNSHAYKEGWLLKEFSTNNIKLLTRNFGTIGKLFTNSTILNKIE